MSETTKSIIFKTKFDTSDLPQAVEAMKRQMNQSNIGAKMKQAGMGDLVNMPKSEEVVKTRRELELAVRSAYQAMQINLRDLEKQKELYKSIQMVKREEIKDAQALAKHDADALKNLKERARLEETIKKQGQGIVGGLDDLQGKKQGLAASFKPLLSAAGIPAGAGAAAMASAAAVIASKIFTQYVALPREISVAQGAATQGLVGNRIQELQSGEVVKSMAFKEDWQDALKMASNERNSGIREEIARWTSLKGFIGGFIGGDFERAFQSEQGQQEFENAQSIYSAKLQSNPLKTAAVSMYQQNSMRDLAAQRQMGMTDAGYFGAGGFQETANKSGFNPDLALGMAGQIQGAGGSTRGMRGLSVLGLQAQRGSDLTNAGGVLGRISGTAGSSQSSEQIFRKLMEESISAGLDKSEFREEQRRFADATSEILANSGVKTAQDASNILSAFTKYLGGEPTVKGIEGARSAYEKAQAFSSETSGRGGALQFSAFLQDSKLRRAGGLGIGGLMEMPDKDIIPSNQFVIAEANKAGISPEEMAERVHGAKRKEQLGVLNISSRKMDRLRNELQSRGLGTDLSADELKNLPQEVQGTYTDVLEKIRQQYGYTSPQESSAAARGIIGLDQVGGGAITGAGLYGAEMGGGTGRMGDAAVAASGAVAQEFLENFREFSQAITPTTEAVMEWTRTLMMSAAVLRNTSANNQAGAQRAIADYIADQQSRASKKSKQDQASGHTAQ